MAIILRLRCSLSDLRPFFFFSSRRRHTILTCDWSSDVCSSDLFEIVRREQHGLAALGERAHRRPEVVPARSEERRVGKECRSRRSPDPSKNNRELTTRAVIDSSKGLSFGHRCRSALHYVLVCLP